MLKSDTKLACTHLDSFCRQEMQLPLAFPLHQNHSSGNQPPLLRVDA